MKLCSLGLVRDQHDQWIRCADVFFNYSDGSCWINFTALRVGLLQGRAFDSVDQEYLSGDIYVGDQWIGFVNTSDMDTGTWYTATILLIPCVIPTQIGIIRAEVRQ